MRAKQESFLPKLEKANTGIRHGGDLARGRRKSRRPLDPKQALHLVLRSSKARGSWSMLHPKNCEHIHDFTHKLADRWGMRIYRYANVGNHIHLLIKFPSRAVFQRFLKELSGTIAIIVTGARKGSSLKKNEASRGFWDHLAFTRIVRFGRDFDGVMRYLIKNLFEAAGLPMKKLLAQGYRIVSIRGGPLPSSL